MDERGKNGTNTFLLYNFLRQEKNIYTKCCISSFSIQIICNRKQMKEKWKKINERKLKEKWISSFMETLKYSGNCFLSAWLKPKRKWRKDKSNEIETGNGTRMIEQCNLELISHLSVMFTIFRFIRVPTGHYHRFNIYLRHWAYKSLKLQSTTSSLNVYRTFVSFTSLTARSCTIATEFVHSLSRVCRLSPFSKCDRRHCAK